MLDLNLKNETSKLKAVILGTAIKNGKTPTVEEAYDPKSLEHILAGTYPIEKDMVKEIEGFHAVLKKYDVAVYSPEIIDDYNQIFVRDIGFVIDNFFIKANILPEREKELKAIEYILKKINPNKILQPPDYVHIEGGDVLLWNDYIFVGTYKGEDYSNHITARTNIYGVEYLKKMFPKKNIKEFDLIKSKTEARDNALHLDCCFQPIGIDKAIIFKEGFRNVSDYYFLKNLFGEENIFHITRDEMYEMNSNIFSINPHVIVSEKNFTRLNKWLRLSGFIVEEIDYAEISKQEGLLRCSTLPLIRE